MVILGVDGLDPRLLERFIAEGVTPNLAQLARDGGFERLGTTLPPQSPVAWSTFATGLDPGGHGVFDFLALDRARLVPRESMSRVVHAGLDPLEIGPWRLPLGSEHSELQRKGEAFWQILERHGVSTAIVSIPANYPPVPSPGRALSGMGTPDLRGSSGIFTFFSDDPAQAAGAVAGGAIESVHVQDGELRAELAGPPDPYRSGEPPARVPFRVHVDPVHPVVSIEIGGRRVLLREGEWSEWLPLRFELLAALQHVPGMVRFHLRSAHPHLALYASPVNIDPLDPAQPIAAPLDYARELAGTAGRFYTEEMPEDTKALSAGVLSASEFLAQSALVLAERTRLLDAELARFRAGGSRGLLFFYFSTLDQRSHVLWRESEPALPGVSAAAAATRPPPDLAAALRESYREIDAIVGRARAALAPHVRLIVMSDHGFQAFRRQAHLNRWLEREGYLVLSDAAQRDRVEWLQGLDWSRTRAFAIGLNALYLNVRGRERYGSVEPAQRAALAREIAQRLLEWRDPEDGAAVVTQAALREDAYSGPHVAEAPDLIVGYGQGYRASWATTRAAVPELLLEDNEEPWSGDHCVDPRLVPGVLLSNGELRGAGDLRDLTSSILAYFGAPRAPEMSERTLF